MNTSSYLALIVPAQQVKTVKNELEHEGLLNKELKITKLKTGQNYGNSMVIPTTLLASIDQPIPATAEAVSLASLRQRFPLTTIETSMNAEKAVQQNPLQAAVKEAAPLLNTPLGAEGYTEEDLLSSTPSAYAIYPPLLLLPQTILERQLWRNLVAKLNPGVAEDDQESKRESSCLVKFFAQVAANLSVTHIAINAPIPTDRDTPSAKVDSNAESFATKTAQEDMDTIPPTNVLRSPTNLLVLHGNFGPALSPFPQYVPMVTDFKDAFWVRTTQNTIHQTWAPRYTMFSKGNVTEKARLLSLPSVTELKAQPWTAVDLFAGIGYFAFSYAQAGASKVLCWDLNPWSCEALRRGAALNSWRSTLMVSPARQSTQRLASGKTLSLHDEADPRFLVFCQSNSHAAEHIAELRHSVPPVRHVNCGMLPDAGRAWRTAVKCLDWSLGGWLHLHETVRLEHIDGRAETIRAAVADLVQKIEIEDHNTKDVAAQTTEGLPNLKKCVSLEHVERVKSVGPRMMHIVVDLCVSGLQSAIS